MTFSLMTFRSFSVISRESCDPSITTFDTLPLRIVKSHSQQLAIVAAISREMLLEEGPSEVLRE